MATCPFAVQKPITGSSGSYLGGPFKIVHHTTEGSTAQGAFDAFEANRSDPHFTVDSTTIFQHVDTGVAARSLRNPAGGVQTNRDSAVQVEIVGFAHLPKSRATLRNVARLCRWIEDQHGVPKVWPNGPPKPAINGNDPGGHNRNAANWDTKGGHYGHSNVPENIHWDPAYTADEAAFVLAFDPEAPPSPTAEAAASSIAEEVDMSDAVTRMPDHHHVDSDD
jgi:N-acetylmuramoyl-L-alanine amidase-like protein